MKKWTSKIKRVINKEGRRGRRKNINLEIVSANNHYAGFGPGTANIFRKMVGLPEATLEEKSDSLSNTNPPIKAKYSLRLYYIKLHNCVLLICCCSSILTVPSMSVKSLNSNVSMLQCSQKYYEFFSHFH
jgi:hypothetical protein